MRWPGQRAGPLSDPTDAVQLAVPSPTRCCWRPAGGSSHPLVLAECAELRIHEVPVDPGRRPELDGPPRFHRNCRSQGRSAGRQGTAHPFDPARRHPPPTHEEHDDGRERTGSRCPAGHARAGRPVRRDRGRLHGRLSAPARPAARHDACAGGQLPGAGFAGRSGAATVTPHGELPLVPDQSSHPTPPGFDAAPSVAAGLRLCSPVSPRRWSSERSESRPAPAEMGSRRARPSLARSADSPHEIDAPLSEMPCGRADPRSRRRFRASR